MFVQHARVDHRTDGSVDVVRAEHLKEVDHAAIGRLQLVFRERGHVNHRHALPAGIVLSFDDVEPPGFAERALLAQIFAILS